MALYRCMTLPVLSSIEHGNTKKMSRWGIRRAKAIYGRVQPSYHYQCGCTAARDEAIDQLGSDEQATIQSFPT